MTTRVHIIYETYHGAEMVYAADHQREVRLLKSRLRDALVIIEHTAPADNETVRRTVAQIKEVLK